MNVKNTFILKNQVAIVTGGAGRLGPKFGEALAEAGAYVVLTDLDEKKGREAARRISRRLNGKVSFQPVDVTEEHSIQALVRSVVKKFKRIDILVNAAMGLGKKFYSSVDSYRWDDWNHVMTVNVGGTFLCSRAVAKEMKKQKRGSMINIGSIYGVVAADQKIYGKSGINSPASYAASKGAVINLTRYLAVYWAPFGIRVNAISPGGVYDGQEKGFVQKYSSRAPLGRMLDRDELKGAIVFLASPASSYITGHNLLVDGGWTAW
jgi:NAD(P)-dependent dehydrogenase (short-subunit alcohol dehydrogenase family)